MATSEHILFFNQISISDIGKVGGKNTSLGEIYNQLNPMGINIPNGFAVTAEGYQIFCKANNLEKVLKDLLLSLDTKEYSKLSSIGEKARNLVLSASIPEEISFEIRTAYKELSKLSQTDNLGVAVCSSATSEDLPSASFAGRMESFLNISGEKQLFDAVHRCYASPFTNRAIKYQHDMGFTGMDIAISVGVKQMVRSDKVSFVTGIEMPVDRGFVAQ